jgi:hypothetical protein
MEPPVFSTFSGENVRDFEKGYLAIFLRRYGSARCSCRWSRVPGINWLGGSFRAAPSAPCPRTS